LASLAAEIDGQESEAMKVAEDARGALIGAKSRLDRLEPQVVSTAKAAVEVLRTRANEAAEAATHAAQSDEQSYGAEEQYQLAEAELQKANSAYVDLEQSAQGAEGVATSTAGRVQMGDALLETSQRTAQAKSEADGRVGDAGRDLESAEEATKTAATAEAEAERAVGAGREAAENENGRLGSVIEDAAKAVEEAGRLAMLAQTFSETESAEQIAKAAFETAETEAANAGAQRDGAVKAREAATSSFQQAEQVLEEARVAGAAAACATHAYPGEPCPVCKRALPRDFEPPTAPPELTKAEEETARARAARDAAVETAASAQGRFDAAEKALSLAQEASTNATGERANKEAAYELAGGDDQLLRTQGLAEAAERERRAAEAAAREAHTAVAKAEGLWKARKEALRPLEEARGQGSTRLHRCSCHVGQSGVAGCRSRRCLHGVRWRRGAAKGSN
jgi:exonuclease SbcC